MAKPESWRRNAASYPLSVTANTRFQDLDLNGHLNNVAFAALFENARVRVNRDARPWDERPGSERTMVAAVTINYLAEGSFPDDVMITSGIGSIGTSSWTILQAMFQNDHCIATCETVVVCRTDNQAKPLRAEIRDYLEGVLVVPQREAA
jgi:acyl-CoA thioester hydrolase